MILLCAAVLDPRYKLNLLRYCYKKIHVDEFAAEEQVNKVVTKLYELFDEYKVLNPSPSITNPSNNVEQNRQDDLFDDYADYLTTVAPQSQKSSLDLYLEEPTKDPKVDLDILEFWKASSVSYRPELASMARDLLTIPVSSVALGIQYWRKGDNSLSKFPESRNNGGFSLFARLGAHEGHR